MCVCVFLYSCVSSWCCLLPFKIFAYMVLYSRIYVWSIHRVSGLLASKCKSTSVLSLSVSPFLCVCVHEGGWTKCSDIVCSYSRPTTIVNVDGASCITSLLMSSRCAADDWARAVPTAPPAHPPNNPHTDTITFCFSHSLIYSFSHFHRLTNAQTRTHQHTECARAPFSGQQARKVFVEVDGKGACDKSKRHACYK